MCPVPRGSVRLFPIDLNVRSWYDNADKREGGLMRYEFAVRRRLQVAVVVAAVAVGVSATMAVPGGAQSGGPECKGAPATFVGSDGSDRVDGTSGNDVFVGRGGDDLFRGGPGKDLACGQGGNDKLRGGSNDDALFGGRAGDVLRGNGGNDLLRGNRGPDVIDCGAGNDHNDSNGGPGNDDVDECE